MLSAIAVAFNTTSSDVFIPLGETDCIKKSNFEVIFFVLVPISKFSFTDCAVTLYVVTLSGNLNFNLAIPLPSVEIVSKCAVSANLALAPPPPPPSPPLAENILSMYVEYVYTGYLLLVYIVSNKLVISSDSKWDYIKLTQADSSVIYALKLNNLNTKLNAELNASSSSYHSLRNLYRGALSVVNPQNNDLRSSDTYFNNESKLFNSEFYRPTYVYDSFSYTVQLEKCELSYYITNGVQYFYIAPSVRSVFLGRLLASTQKAR